MSNFSQDYQMEHEESSIHNFYYKKCNTHDESFEYDENVIDIRNRSCEIGGSFYRLSDLKRNIISSQNDYAQNPKEIENKNEIINPKEKFISDSIPIMIVPEICPDFEKELNNNNSKDLNLNNKNLNDSFLDNFDDELLYEESEMKNLSKAEQKQLLENKLKDFCNDSFEIINISNNKSIKSYPKTKNYSDIDSENEKSEFFYISLPKFPITKKDNYIKESSNDNQEGKPNQQKKTNSEKKENKNGNKNSEGEQNSKDKIKNKEANYSFNKFEHDTMNLEFDKDSIELFDIKNYSFYKSEKDFFGNCPKKRDKEDGSSEEDMEMEDNSYDNYNIVNSQISNKTYSIPYNFDSEDSINVSKTSIFPSNSLLFSSSAFSSSENLENYNPFDLNSKIERTEDDNKSLEHLFNKKRKKEIFGISKIKKFNSNKRLNFENNNNSCIIGNINQEFLIPPNKNNNKSMINCVNKNNKKKSNKKTPKNIFFTKITINDKNMIDNSHEKKTIAANNLSDIDKGDDPFIQKKRDKVFNKINEKIKEKIKKKNTYEIERTLCRIFRDYLSDNKTLFEDIISQDNNFWDKFLSTKNLSSFSMFSDNDGIKCKSFSHKLMKKSFSFDGVDELYKRFISDIQLQNKTEEKLKKEFKKKLEEKLKEKLEEKIKEKMYTHKIYKKNFHIIYCAKYKEEDLILDN